MPARVSGYGASMLECVVNVSEGRYQTLIDSFAQSCQDCLLDVHSDGAHNRSVFTLAGLEVESCVRRLARRVLASLDIRVHRGAHPRIGVLDVVPFIPLGDTPMSEAIEARNRFCRWAGSELALPCFTYGPERSLPALRREAFGNLAPQCGPAQAHPSAGGCAVGARGILVAYNLWLETASLSQARSIAKEIRGPAVAALGFDLDGRAQVSMNLLDPAAVGPGRVYDEVASRAVIERAELVGLIPQWLLDSEPAWRWARLGLCAQKTIEARLGLLRPTDQADTRWEE